MGTEKDVFCFLNEFDFADKLDNDFIEKLVAVNKLLIREFEEYNVSKMKYALNSIDEIKLLDVTNDFDYRLERTNSLRSFFYLISIKHLVDTNSKQENKEEFDQSIILVFNHSIVFDQFGFIFNQINKFTKQFYSNISIIIIHYYLKPRLSILHRKVFKKISQNPDYVNTHCKDKNNPLHFAIRK